jgi:hypothetical protein
LLQPLMVIIHSGHSSQQNEQNREKKTRRQVLNKSSI